MKALGKTKFCPGLQIEHFSTGFLAHRSTFTKKILKRFYMDKAHTLSSPMVVHSLDVKKDLFGPSENGEYYLVLKYHSLMSLVHLCILLTILT